MIDLCQSKFSQTLTDSNLIQIKQPSIITIIRSTTKNNIKQFEQWKNKRIPKSNDSQTYLGSNSALRPKHPKVGTTFTIINSMRPSMKSPSWTGTSSIRNLRSTSLIFLCRHLRSKDSRKRTLSKWLKSKDVSFPIPWEGVISWRQVEQVRARPLPISFLSLKSCIEIKLCPSTVSVPLSWSLSGNWPCKCLKCSTPLLIIWKSVSDLSSVESQLSTNSKKSVSWMCSFAPLEDSFNIWKKRMDLKLSTCKCSSLTRPTSCSTWGSETLSTQFCKAFPGVRLSSFLPPLTTKFINSLNFAWKTLNAYFCTQSGRTKYHQVNKRKRMQIQFTKPLPNWCNITWLSSPKISSMCCTHS